MWNGSSLGTFPGPSLLEADLSPPPPSPLPRHRGWEFRALIPDEQMLSNQILQGAEGTVGAGGGPGAVLMPLMASPDCRAPSPSHWSPPIPSKGGLPFTPLPHPPLSPGSGGSASTGPNPTPTLLSRNFGGGEKNPAGACPLSCACLAHPKPAPQHRSKEAASPLGVC